MSGNFGEMSGDTHLLVVTKAKSWGCQWLGYPGAAGEDVGEAKQDIVVSSIHRRLGVMAVRC